MINPITRQELIDALVSYWFSENEDIEEILKINNQWDEIEDQIKLDRIINNNAKTRQTTSLVREAFFRKSIIYTYECRCSFCGLKIKHKYSNIIDAAHIKPLAKFYDNRINNGIALCKNHHWAFDIGLFSITDDYIIIVASNFEEDSPQAKSIKSFNGSPIILPQQNKYYPMLQALQWHRKNVFLGNIDI
jgi:putative restriction endonuclease